jgi:CRISPR/Cas system-associated endoribonuclease Cas2
MIQVFRTTQKVHSSTAFIKSCESKENQELARIKKTVKKTVYEILDDVVLIKIEENIQSTIYWYGKKSGSPK